MCKTYHYQDPICDCVHISDSVKLCPLYTARPENATPPTFRPKLITKHCQGLNLLFNGIDYVSVDVQNDDGNNNNNNNGNNNDVVPTGLDCPNVGLCLVQEDTMRPCDLCDSEDAVKFLKVKGVEYTFDKAARVKELLGETAAGRVEKDGKGKAAAAAGVGKEGKGKAAVGKSGEKSGGELVDRAEGSSGERGGGVASRVKRAREMVERRLNEAARKRKRSGLAESASASMGSDG